MDAANHAWGFCAALADNLRRAAATLGDAKLATAPGDAARPHRQRAARIACPQRRPVLHLPEHWLWAQTWLVICLAWSSGLGPWAITEAHPP